MQKKNGYEQGITLGKELGRKEGINQGINREKIAIAKNMLKENIDIEIIIRITGLSKEEIEKIEV